MPEDERCPLLRRQLVECVSERSKGISNFDLTLRIVRRRSGVGEVPSALGPRRRTTPAQESETAIQRDAMYPCPKAAPAAEVTEAPPRLQEGVLTRFLCLRPIAQHAQRQAVDVRLVGAHQMLEGERVAGAGQGDEGPLLHLWRGLAHSVRPALLSRGEPLQGLTRTITVGIRTSARSSAQDLASSRARITSRPLMSGPMPASVPRAPSPRRDGESLMDQRESLMDQRDGDGSEPILVAWLAPVSAPRSGVRQVTRLQSVRGPTCRARSRPDGRVPFRDHIGHCCCVSMSASGDLAHDRMMRAHAEIGRPSRPRSRPPALMPVQLRKWLRATFWRRGKRSRKRGDGQ